MMLGPHNNGGSLVGAGSISILILFSLIRELGLAVNFYMRNPYSFINSCNPFTFRGSKGAGSDNLPTCSFPSDTKQLSN